jgi:RNA polymerase sigma factor (TIGR02999 family)
MDDKPAPVRSLPDISALLQRWTQGDAVAAEEVIARTYGELRRLARGYTRREPNAHSVQATAVLHEAFLRLLKNGPGRATTRDAFFRLMAAEMRRRLIDRARRRLADKRGGGAIHEPLRTSGIIAVGDSGEDVESTLERLDGALRVLSHDFPRAAQVVELRFLSGLTTDETAARLGLSSGTVKRDWTFARAWLAAALESRSADHS